MHTTATEPGQNTDRRWAPLHPEFASGTRQSRIEALGLRAREEERRREMLERGRELEEVVEKTRDAIYEWGVDGVLR